MKNINNKKGSAIITAIGMGIVLLIVIAGVFSFSKYRTQTVVNESKKVKALALAEAGLEVALGELFNNASFQTHEVDKPSSAEESPKWKESSLNRECLLQPNNENGHNFQIDSSTSGTISGTLGDGKFKVRIGNIPYDDNPNTKAIDESKAYVFIEAMGMYDKTVRKIEAVVNRRYPCREFLMYDGGILSVVYGQSGQQYTNDSNIFSVGHLYGHQGVEISQIKYYQQQSGHDGTKQELKDIDAILSGAGGIFFYSDVKAHFKNKNSGEGKDVTIKANCIFPTNGSYPEGKRNHGEFPTELKDQTPAIPQEISSWVKDKNSGISIPPKAPSFAQYKKEAQSGGKYYSSGNTQYRVTDAYSDSGRLNVVYLDFGSGNSKIREANNECKNIPTNGVFYSDTDIVIKGNPPKDVSIVSEKNIFVAGDFNQNSGGGDGEEKYGFPQYYSNNALKDQTYEPNIEKLFENDKDSNATNRYHVAATIVAKERVVFDHRSPVDCFENELVPYLKYELAKAINTDSSKNIDQTLDPNGWKSLSIKASDTYDGFKESIASFTKKFKISNSDQLAEKLKNNYKEGGDISSDNLDQMTLDAWKAYVDDFNGSTKGDISPSATDLGQGIYQLLFRLRARMCGNKDLGDAIVTDLQEPSSNSALKKDEKDYLFYPEMTTNGMFVSCGKLNNEFYAGPDVEKYFDEIGWSGPNEGFIKKWYYTPNGFLHRVFGSETNLRLYDVKDTSKNKYRPPLRRKIYDETLPWLGDYSNKSLELTGFVVLSWADLAANEEEFNAF